MQIVFFTDRPNFSEAALLIEEARKRGHNAMLQCPWDVRLPEVMAKVDIVHALSPIFYRDSTFEFLNRYLILKQYRENGAVIINSLDSLVNYSKAYFTIHAANHGLPHPKTLITENIDVAYDFIMNLHQKGKSAVLKPLAGGGGKGVAWLTKLRDIEDMRQYLSYYSRSHGRGVFYIEEFIENLGYDIRIFIINNEVIGRMKRFNPEDFRYNASLGGIVETFDSSELDEVALRAAEVMKFEISGVDILPSVEGCPYILEVNGCPGFRHLIQATGINIPKKIIAYFEQVRSQQ